MLAACYGGDLGVCVERPSPRRRHPLQKSQIYLQNLKIFPPPAGDPPECDPPEWRFAPGDPPEFGRFGGVTPPKRMHCPPVMEITIYPVVGVRFCAAPGCVSG